MINGYMKFRIKVSGFKNCELLARAGGGYVIRGEEISEIYTIEAKDVEEAEIKAIRKFVKRGYLFDEICWIEKVD